MSHGLFQAVAFWPPSSVAISFLQHNLDGPVLPQALGNVETGLWAPERALKTTVFPIRSFPSLVHWCTLIWASSGPVDLKSGIPQVMRLQCAGDKCAGDSSADTLYGPS